jgi:hypothetical protein
LEGKNPEGDFWIFSFMMGGRLIRERYLKRELIGV